jgi:hypothetical protein
MSDDPNKFKIRKLQAEILGLGSVIRQLRQPGMHHAATQPLLCRKRADLECLVRRIPGNRGFDVRKASSGLIGLSNTINAYGKTRAFQKQAINEALKFPL